MTEDIVFSHECIILDACCVINLYASGQMERILRSISKSVAVAAYVRDKEALRVLSGIKGDPAQKYERIDLQPFIDDQLLTVVSPKSEEEFMTFINFAAALGGDGEAVTGAIALHRNWSIGSDDRRATSYFAQQMPHIQLISTPELIKHWVDTDDPVFEIISMTLQKIRIKARYEPHTKHNLYHWWQSYKGKP